MTLNLLKLRMLKKVVNDNSSRLPREGLLELLNILFDFIDTDVQGSVKMMDSIDNVIDLINRERKD